MLVEKTKGSPGFQIFATYSLLTFSNRHVNVILVKSHPDLNALTPLLTWLLCVSMNTAQVKVD